MLDGEDVQPYIHSMIEGYIKETIASGMDTRFDLVVFWRKKSGNRSLPLFAELAGDCTRRK